SAPAPPPGRAFDPGELRIRPGGRAPAFDRAAGHGRVRCLDRSTREQRIDGVARVTPRALVSTRVVVDPPFVLQPPRLIEHEDVGHLDYAERLGRGLRVT